MLNSIWPALIIIGCIFGLMNGKVMEINDAILKSTNDALEIIITMFGTVSLWNGLMCIANSTSITKFFMKILKPIMKKLFSDIDASTEEYRAIAMNIVSNIMGLGNAATPLGIKAIKLLNNKNPEKPKLSKSIIMFIVINTVSLQIIPTTVITLRDTLGSTNTTKIIIPIWITTFCSSLAAIISAKILIKKEFL